MAEPNRTGGGNVADVQEIDELRKIGPRRPGSEAERRAARHIQKRLEEMGREAQVEPIRVRPGMALTHMVHAIAGVVASVIAVYLPGIGLALAALTAASAFGDLTGAYHLVRSLTPARASQNVISDEEGDKPGLIVLVAHYDQASGGMLQSPRLAPVWPRALFGSLAVITVCSGVRLLGLDPIWLTVIQFLATVVLIVLTPLFADLAIANPNEEADDSSTAVATVLGLGAAYGGSFEHFDLMLLFTGASAASGLGMRNWLGRHRKELDAEATAVICVDNSPGFAEKEGAIFTSRMHPTLVEMAGDYAEPYTSRELSDAYLSRATSLPTLRIKPGADIGALLQRIDAEIGQQLA